MEPELIQAFNNLSQQLTDIKGDIKEIKDQTRADHEQLIRVATRQEEIIRDVDALGDKVRSLQTAVWKISLTVAGLGASGGGALGYFLG